MTVTSLSFTSTLPILQLLSLRLAMDHTFTENNRISEFRAGNGISGNRKTIRSRPGIMKFFYAYSTAICQFMLRTHTSHQQCFSLRDEENESQSLAAVGCVFAARAAPAIFSATDSMSELQSAVNLFSSFPMRLGRRSPRMAPSDLTRSLIAACC